MNISHNMLAKMSGLQQSSISALIRGEKSRVSWETIQRIALALNVPVSALTDDAIEVPGPDAVTVRPAGRPPKDD